MRMLNLLPDSSDVNGHIKVLLFSLFWFCWDQYILSILWTFSSSSLSKILALHKPSCFLPDLTSLGCNNSFQWFIQGSNLLGRKKFLSLPKGRCLFITLYINTSRHPVEVMFLLLPSKFSVCRHFQTILDLISDKINQYLDRCFTIRDNGNALSNTSCVKFSRIYICRLCEFPPKIWWRISS